MASLYLESSREKSIDIPGSRHRAPAVILRDSLGSVIFCDLASSSVSWKMATAVPWGHIQIWQFPQAKKKKKKDHSALHWLLRRQEPFPRSTLVHFPDSTGPDGITSLLFAFPFSDIGNGRIMPSLHQYLSGNEHWNQVLLTSHSYQSREDKMLRVWRWDHSKSTEKD